MNSIISKRYAPGKNKQYYTTEFQLHKSQNYLSLFKNVRDYSQYKLAAYINNVCDLKQKLALNIVLEQYKLGLVAVAWRLGKPVWLKVSK
jgi:hypothetical protein